MTRHLNKILIILSVVLIAVMVTAISLTAAYWTSTDGEKADYGPVINVDNWNVWQKYFVFENIYDEESEENPKPVLSSAIVGYNNTNLEDVIIPLTNTTGVTVSTIRNTLFKDDTTKKMPVTLYISANITEIEPGAFSNLVNLQTVVFADGLEVDVSAYAFQGCISLTTVIIGSRTVNFATTSFKGCYNLTTVGSLTAEQVNALK